MTRNTICLWHEHDAEEAARFYAETFPDSSVGAVHSALADYPDGKAGDALIVEFTVVGIPCIGLNGGSQFTHSKASLSRLQPPIRRRPTATGTRSSAMADRKASAAGARTSRASAGRSPRAC